MVEIFNLRTKEDVNEYYTLYLEKFFINTTSNQDRQKILIEHSVQQLQHLNRILSGKKIDIVYKPNLLWFIKNRLDS